MSTVTIFFSSSFIYNPLLRQHSHRLVYIDRQYSTTFQVFCPCFVSTSHPYTLPQSSVLSLLRRAFCILNFGWDIREVLLHWKNRSNTFSSADFDMSLFGTWKNWVFFSFLLFCNRGDAMRCDANAVLDCLILYDMCCFQWFGAGLVD
jgi:hypothetical protein